MSLTIEHIPDNYKKIRFGLLTFVYKEGTIRKICTPEGAEILRSIYPAVRDRNWGTVPFEVIHEQIEEKDNHLIIQTSLHFKQGEIDFDAAIELEISTSGAISYQFRGRVNSDFLKNRIGINILHPIKECRGKAAELTTSSGKTINASFPQIIAPNCPMQDMAAMVWRPSESINARLSFSGDTFEMEDQRNWIDASFKTYSTPLALGFPVKVSRGSVIQQKVVLELDQSQTITKILNKKPAISLSVSVKSSSLPRLGIAKNPGNSLMSDKESMAIGSLEFDFIKGIIDLSAKDWNYCFDRTLTEANRIQSQVYFELWLTENPNENEIEQLLLKLKTSKKSIEMLGLFSKKTTTSEGFAVTDLAGRIRRLLPEIRLAGGSFGYYAELNRSIIDPTQFDDLSFTVSPQVHTYDDMSLLENLEGIAEAVNNATEKYNLPVSIGAITLRQRMNFVATAVEQTPTDHLPDRVDARQSGKFAALWTLGAIKRLIVSGAKSAVFYECTGQCGIMNNLNPEKGFGKFPEVPLQLYPLFGTFMEMLQQKSQCIYPLISSEIEKADGLFVELEEHRKIYCWNYTEVSQKIALPSEFTKHLISSYEIDFETFQWKETDFDESIPGYGFMCFLVNRSVPGEE